ncbi:MAG: hypothetical protein ACOYD1_13470 [Candidatus Nanopelagicales bacterium]
MTPESLRLARIVWDYHQLRQEPIPGDLILALGTNDLRVGEFAAPLARAAFLGAGSSWNRAPPPPVRTSASPANCWRRTVWILSGSLSP